MVYQIVTDEDCECSSSFLSAINITVKDGVSMSKVVLFNPAEDTNKDTDVNEEIQDEKKWAPDKFADFVCQPNSKDGWVTMMPYRYNTWTALNDDEDNKEEYFDDDRALNDGLNLPLSHFIGEKRSTHGFSKDKQREIVLVDKNKNRKRKKTDGFCRNRELSVIPFTPVFDPIPLEQFGLNANSLCGGFSGSHLMDEIDNYRSKVEKYGKKWHAEPSVLVMGYTSFLTLMREDSKFAHRKYMAKVLRESPGLLVLDEGHNPRSTESRLRKALMKVDIDLRILLSGTLFQNNFCEYFNTLCLARPKFVYEVLIELDQKFQKNQAVQKAPPLLEKRAWKFFLDIIAKKIDRKVGDERLQGLNMLRNMTSGFIDNYEGSGSGSGGVLPGLQIYTLLMNSTSIQHEILTKLQNIMSTYHGYPLKLELLITLVPSYPSLIEKLKHDAKKGSKVMFMLNLVLQVVNKEKIIIFCHNIAPICLFLELFEKIFKWQRGREILTLIGDLELFERGRVIDKFEEPGGESRILLASITACAEGISLTAASRVIMVDSEWNPSKTKQAIARAFRPGQQKVVYVYQLLSRGTLEEDKYKRKTWKEWVSSMIFREEFVEDPSQWQAEKIEDDVLREIVEEDKVKSFHMIMKNEIQQMADCGTCTIQLSVSPCI
ncbi:hypothetical protein CARUB_v10019346mg [Capsella rubella]|uniref:Helicase C-terminal domain-containing protein n=1 Tax=Capsella rubella TaxID=81985 RepID=R0FSY0_9BRAS|nr:hypothetical protein CARUB_v10019346mg [Capsella rubella]